jgi:hypothetical protein
MPGAGLFPAPGSEAPALSRHLAEHHQLIQPWDTVKWTRRAAKSRLDCQECAMVQHETRGAYHPRRRAKLRRTTSFGSRLDLCNAHAQAWKTRDACHQKTQEEG